MSDNSLKLHINALWTIAIIIVLFIGNLSLSKSKGKRYTFADARIEHMLLKNHCITYSESQIDFLIKNYGDYGHNGKVIKTPFNEWLRSLSGESCEKLEFSIKRELNK